MRDNDDRELKSEIDNISKKIDAIIKKINDLDPAHKEKTLDKAE